MSTEIKPIHTPCKKCVFATYENNTQTSCFLNLLDKFKNNNIEILEAYDEEKEFYIINDKKCVGYREEKYFESRKLNEKTLQDKADYVLDKLKLNYSITINIQNFTARQLTNISSQISQLSIKPTNLYVIRYKQDREKYSYNFIENFISKCKIPKWKIKTILDDKEEYINVLHNVVNENKTTKFMLSIGEETEGINVIINTAQRIIYDDLSTFIVLADKNKKTILFNTDVYRFGIFHGQDILSDTTQYTII